MTKLQRPGERCDVGRRWGGVAGRLPGSPPGGPLPAGLRPLSQVSALKRSPRALGAPYRGRMGKRDALARLAFRLTADVPRATAAAVACTVGLFSG